MQTLGLAARAGKLFFGEGACLDAVRGHKACLLLLDADASDNTTKRFVDACRFHDVSLWKYTLPAHDLAAAVGRPGGKVFALADKGFFRRLCQLEGVEKAPAPRPPNQPPCAKEKERKDIDNDGTSESVSRQSREGIGKTEVEK